MNYVQSGRYLHHGAHEYTVIGLACCRGTVEELVVDGTYYWDDGLWVRPAAWWNL